MSYPKKLLRLRPSRGVAFDTPASELAEDFWSTCRNVNFRNGHATRIAGARAAYGVMPVSVLHLLNARMFGTNFWLVFGASAIHAEETSNSANITGAALNAVTQPWQWHSALLNGVPIVTNGLNAPRYWAGNVVNPFVDLPGWPVGTLCKGIAAYRFHVFAFDIDGAGGQFESKVLWSDAAPPGTVPASWTPAANNQAGSMELSDTPGPALCAVPLRGSLAMYKRSSMYAIDYTNDSEVFGQRVLFTSSGALTRHAVSDINGQHLVVSDGDILLTDGTNRRSVGQDRVREWMFGQLSQDNYENVFNVFNRARGEAIIGFPENGQQHCTLALVYDVGRDRFGVRELPAVTCGAVGLVNDSAQSDVWDADLATWDSDTTIWNAANYSLATESLLLGYGTTMEQQDTADAVVRNAHVGRYDLTFGEPERVKYVKRVHVRTKPSAGTLLVRVGGRMSPTDAIAWTNETPLLSPEQLVNVYRSDGGAGIMGRYISVEVRSAGSEVWTVTGIDLEAEMRGYH